VELPDAKAIFPYLGLFTLVTLTPGVIGDPIPTLFEPPLSVIRGKEFAKARSNASPTGKNVARIFAPLALVDDSPRNLGAIPISPDDQTFNEKRYWRLPVSSAHIFAALIGRLDDDLSDCLDIRLARIIHSILTLQCFEKPLPYEIHGNVRPSNGGGGGGHVPNDDNQGGRGPMGSRTPSKRKRAVKSGASPSKRTKKVRTTSGGSESRAFDESGGELLARFDFPLLNHSRNLEFPSVGQYQNQQSDHFQIASSTYIPEDDVSAHLISSVRDDDSDFEDGLSECLFLNVNAISLIIILTIRRICHNSSRQGQSSYMAIWPLVFDQQDCFHCQGYKSYMNLPSLSLPQSFPHYIVYCLVSWYCIL